MKLKISFCTLFALLLSISGLAWATESEKWSEKNQAVINEKRQKIENEIGRLKNHPWAGEYYSGDGLGTNVRLTLAPENGFTIKWTGCEGLYDQNHGTVKWDDNLVELSFAFDPTDEGIGHYASEYKPIRWGNRVYLIPSNEIIKFVNEINASSEPRDGVHGFFFLRLGDEEKEVTSKPELPGEFMEYLLDRPIDAAIVSVSKPVKSTKNKDLTTVVVIVNKGKKDGLLPGMELYVTKPGDSYDSVELTKVGETQSEGRYQYDNNHPAVGWQLSTCPRWGGIRQCRQ